MGMICTYELSLLPALAIQVSFVLEAFLGKFWAGVPGKSETDWSFESWNLEMEEWENVGSGICNVMLCIQLNFFTLST